jgi:hypothetical protein
MMPSSPAAPPPRRELAASSGFVRAVIVLVVLMVVAMSGIVFWRWATGHEPTTAILVTGEPALDGTVLEVTGYGVPPVTVTLSADNSYRTPIFRLPGTYHVIATWHGQKLVDRDVVIDRYVGMAIELPTILTIQGDASLEGAEVTLSERGAAVGSGSLEKPAGYKWAILVFGGEYRLTLRRAGQPAPSFQRDVLVYPHTPQTVDLSKRS